jgi:uncharacterized membrane protein
MCVCVCVCVFVCTRIYKTACDAESDWVITAIYLGFTNLLLLVTPKTGGQ